MAFVSFVVPTLGRNSLMRAVGSLYAQTDGDWDAVVIGDGCSPEHALKGRGLDRVDQFCPPELFGSAGATRNYGIDLIVEEFLRPKPEWIAFLDDDDYLSPNYVEHLREHSEDYPWAETIVFRMKHPIMGTLPLPNGVLRLGTVGISFAVKTPLFEDPTLRFEPERVSEGFHEDWGFINELVSRDKKIFVSTYIDYFVREATP